MNGVILKTIIAGAVSLILFLLGFTTNQAYKALNKANNNKTMIAVNSANIKNIDKTLGRLEKKMDILLERQR